MDKKVKLKKRLWFVMDGKPLEFPGCCLYHIIGGIKKILTAKKIVAPCLCLNCDNWAEYPKGFILKMYLRMLYYKKIRKVHIKMGIDPNKGWVMYQDKKQ